MVKKEELKQNWEKINAQLTEAKRFLAEKKLDEALYFTWLAAENITNCLKVALNGFYLKEHAAKTYILKEYFIKSQLKKDYSKTFEKLSKYRIVAEFHPYTAIPKDYKKEDIINFLNEIQELKQEAGTILSKRGILN